MRLLFVCKTYRPLLGGVERHVASLAEELAGRHEVTVLAISPQLNAKRPFGWKEKWRGPLPGFISANGGSFGSIVPASASNFQIRILSRPRSAVKAKRLSGERLML